MSSDMATGGLTGLLMMKNSSVNKKNTAIKSFSEFRNNLK